MTVEFALRLASAAARVLAPEGGRALVGKDTRLSGYMFESALEAGFVAAGVNVSLIGPLPTPGIAYLTQRFGCNFGVVISASHNLLRGQRHQVLRRDGRQALRRDRGADRGDCSTSPALTRESIAARPRRARRQVARPCTRSSAPRRCRPGIDLSGLKIVIDCANGAAYKVAPRVLADLGAEIIPIGCSPNGSNINLRCGSTAPELLQLTVSGRAGRRRHRARRRRRPPGHGRPPRPPGGRRPAAVRHRASTAMRQGELRGPGGRHGDEQPRPGARARAPRASRSCAPRSATATCCDADASTAACSAARPPATCCASTAPPPATGS